MWESRQPVRIVEASEETPYVGVMIDFDVATVRELLEQLDSAPRLNRTRSGPCAFVAKVDQPLRRLHPSSRSVAGDTESYSCFGAFDRPGNLLLVVERAAWRRNLQTVPCPESNIEARRQGCIRCCIPISRKRLRVEQLAEMCADESVVVSSAF